MQLHQRRPDLSFQKLRPWRPGYSRYARNKRPPPAASWKGFMRMMSYAGLRPQLSR